MNKLNKILAAVPVVATALMPMSAFAATNYSTSTEGVTYSNAITADAPTNTVNVTVAQKSTFSVTIPKNITLLGTAGQSNAANYTVTTSGNIASNEVINVTPVTSFKMNDSKGVKKALNATVTQSVTKFVNSEAKTAKYSSVANTVALGTTTTGNVKVAGLTAGSWSGNFNFNINLETVTF